MKFLLPLLFSILFPLLLVGQQAKHVPGEALIRLAPATNIRTLVKDLQLFNGRQTQFKAVKEIVPYMRIWQVSFDHTAIAEADFLAELKRSPGIQTAQFNHILTRRNTVPNDLQFQNQWQYINNGLGNCVEGADIDADLAWGITTGGRNALGHDIVVCIVDDGIDPAHEDFGDNIWVNMAEIPGNGIDDDNNGFIDDFAGWNTASNNDNTDANNGHGTPVAGIVGAKGNNGIGVAGVNWDVKLMIVVGGSGQESAVLEAYSFPLAHRMRYNATNGAEGSFVVATNSSWGVDFGQPANAPLWCAFYDTLGVHGILSAGATINGAFDVDEVGDLPTACPSEFMISVTNLNCTGNKVNGAGYGLNTIDLGAPGAGTWTTANNNTYGGFGGTSGATPHVAGAIALLYSAPCPQLTQLALNSPAQAALLVRQALLEGTKPNTSLEGITVTGGTLNLYNSLLLLLQSCGPCPSAFGLAAESVTDSSAVVTWISSDSTLQSSLYWRTAGDSTWQVFEDTLSPVQLNGLLACTAYEFAIEETCADTTVFSAIATFLTEGCCDTPQELNAAATADSTVLTWRAVTAAQAYRVELACTTDTLTLDSVLYNTLTLTGLDVCQTCTVRIQSLCSDGLSPDTLGTVLQFRVPGCGNCIDLQYCPFPAGSEYEYLESVSINDLENISGDDGGYGDYTAQSTSLETGGSYTVTIRPAWVDGVYPENYRVLIDLNQDGTFDLANETVGSVSNSTAPIVEVPIFLPDDAQTGSTRMRIVMSYVDSGAPGCGQTIEGEVEDYCVTITDEIPPCTAPSGAMTLDTLSYQQAVLSWDWDSIFVEYAVRIRPLNSTTWSTTTGLLTPGITFDGLVLCTTYEVQLAGACSQILRGAWSPAFTFTTTCNPACNSNAIMLTAGELTDTTALLSWQAPDAALSYQLQIRKTGTSAWTDYDTEDLQQPLTDLAPCSGYQARLRVRCEGLNNLSLFSSILAFETSCLSTGIADVANILGLQVFPNPFRETLGVQISLNQAQEVTFTLYHASGQALLQEKVFQSQGQQMSNFSTAGLPAGIYWLSVQANEGRAVVRVVKVR
jgi:serine protease